MSYEDQYILDTINNLKNMNSKQLTEDNYLQIFKLLLYVEEFQQNEDMKRYEIKNTTIKFYNPTSKHSTLLKIKLDKPFESESIVRPNDLVNITEVNPNSSFSRLKSYTSQPLKIVCVYKDYIIVASTPR